MSDDDTQQEGTPFPDKVKIEARRLAFFRCCYCHDKPGDQVHHLLPQEEGGQGELDNAILLCVQCHMDYGHRKDKRRQLREARDHWHEMAAKRYGPNESEILRFDELATKNDVNALLAQISELSLTLKASVAQGKTTAPDLANVASTMVNSIAAQPVYQAWAPGTWAPDAWATGVCQEMCGGCGAELPASAKFCSECGTRVGPT